MNSMAQMSFDNYSFAGDVAVIAICGVVVILLTTSYVSHTRSLSIFKAIIAVLVLAAAASIGYHELLEIGNPAYYNSIYALRIIYNALLFGVFFMFALYITVVSEMEYRQASAVAIISTLLFIGIIGADIINNLTGAGFQIMENGTADQKIDVFMIGYFLYVLFLAVLMTRVGNLLYKRVMHGFYGAMIISVIIRLAQMPVHQSTLTTMTFIFPVIAMLYIMHSNPYDVTLGTVDVSAMEEMVRNMNRRGAEFVYMSLLLPDYNEEGKELPRELKAEIRRFADDYFKGCVMFQIGNGNVVLIAPKRRNPDYEQRIWKTLDDFLKLYGKYSLPYKVVIGESEEAVSRKNEYVSLIRSIQQNMKENNIKRVTSEDIAEFNRKEYILHELTDIYNKRDIDDPRVLVYCQPVFNIRTGMFDTAEALMRLELEEAGLVFPDQFIYIAENQGYIHVLTEIILNKTCKELQKLRDEGFHIERISVNVSVLELKDEDFCGDISRIIEGNSVPEDKVAIELTESRSEADFMIMKEKVEELHRRGIKFYLDDFGTGYSNMERIMELPFDMIKFDRSLVIASRDDERSERIVDNLANMFKEMDYSVLYEGVENDMDEVRCREMSASYLQGYKYSRPVPIEQLRDFLSKTSV